VTFKLKRRRHNVEVVGHVHDVDKDAVFARLRLVGYDGRVWTENVSRTLLREKAKLGNFLDPKGVNFDDDDLTRLRADHTIVRSKTERVASLPGWRSSGTDYAWPGRTVRDHGKTLKFHVDPGGLLAQTQGSRGDLETWLADVCPAVAASNFGIFALGVVFAGPLLRFSKAPEGAFFAFTGDSGAGKTGICMAAQAIMGSPERHLNPSWDLSAAGAKDLLSEVRHFTFIIDDTSRDGLPDRQRLDFLGAVAHALGGGGRRRLAKAYEEKQAAAPVRDPALGLTSGEFSQDELAKLTGGAVRGGVAVRLIDIPVPPPDRGGVFDRAVEGKSRHKVVPAGREAAKRQERVVKRTYGVAFPVYRDHLTANVATLETAVQKIELKFVRKQKKRRLAASSSDLRIAEKCGLVLAGLELAIAAGVVPFSRAEVSHAVQVVFDAVMSGRDAAKSEVSRQIRQLRRLLQDDAQTPVLKAGETADRAVAFRKAVDSQKVAYMKPKNLGVALELDAPAVDQLLRELARTGNLRVGADGGFTRPVKLRGKPVRHLVFTPAMLKAKKKKVLIRRKIKPAEKKPNRRT